MRRDPLQDYREVLASCYGERRAQLQGSRPLAAAQTRRVLTAHSFDDGAPIVVVRSAQRVARAQEYDVAVDNPDYRAPQPLDAGPSAAAALSYHAAEARCHCAHAEPERSAPAPAPPAPPRPAQVRAAAPTPPQPALPTSASRSAAQQAFTQKQLKGLIQDNELLADIQSILGGEDKPQPSAAKPQRSEQNVIDAPAPAPEQLTESAAKSEHAIFDKIAQNMRYATAYDLGSLELQRRFESFDRTRPPASSAIPARAASAPPPPTQANVIIDAPEEPAAPGS